MSFKILSFKIYDIIDGMQRLYLKILNKTSYYNLMLKTVFIDINIILSVANFLIGPYDRINSKACGISRISTRYVIVGEDAVQGAWPWQIGLYR